MDRLFSRRIDGVFVLVILAALMLAGSWALGARPAPQPLKVTVSDPVLAHRVQTEFGCRLVADYGPFKVFAADPAIVDALTAAGARRSDEYDVIELNTGPIDTRSEEARKLSLYALEPFAGKRLHLVQFAGPVRPEWYEGLLATGVKVVAYIPHNAYLVWGDIGAVNGLKLMAAGKGPVQWEGPYLDEFKVQPGLRAFLEAVSSKDADPNEIEGVEIQLYDDPVTNAETLAQATALFGRPPVREHTVLHYRNVLMQGNLRAVYALAGRPDIVSIHPWLRHRKMDEIQDIIMIGNLTGNVPSGPGYLAWLTGKGFTQAQFTTSNFAVDVTDSGIDNATTTPNHFGLYVGGNTTLASRVIYSRLEGTPHSGSTLQGCDGHGNLNAHIVGGYNDIAGSPHADANGYHYGLGVCPFVKVGSSVIFDPDTFTNPDYENLQSKAYNDGVRISTNSWGAAVGGAYNADCQAYDALVRDAQPTGSTYPVAGNQEMVIVFSAGNSGSGSNTLGSPGSGKNVFCVGAAENVNPFGANDQCGFGDTASDSANDIASYSSRGPCDDGRIKPDIQAPGTHVDGGVFPASLAPYPVTGTGAAAACFDASGVCAGPGSSNFWPLGQQWYTASTGTSHSCPAVAGASALTRQYFINQGWTAPSPAMNKAFLMNSTRYMTGVSANDTLPSSNQGMGMINLGMAFDGVVRILKDQLPADLLTATGQYRVVVGNVSDPTKPFRVTLAWTDAPGATSGNAYNNNLDLTVTVGGNTYKGNVFSGADSVTGGAADPRNNVESVFVPAGVSGNFLVTITGANIVSDGVPGNGTALDQDYALVIYNGVEVAAPVVALETVTLTAESCAPANGVADVGETVTYAVALRNIGTADTANVVATLQATGGVTAPSAAQAYGALKAGGASVSRDFTFTVDPAFTCGETVTMTLQLQDGSTDLGNVASVRGTGVLGPANTTSSGGISVSIPDNDPVGVLVPVTVSGTGKVAKLVARVRANHTWDGDVTFSLVGPDGTTVILSNRRGSAGDNFGSGNLDCTGTFTVFDDDAATAIGSGTPPFAGSYRPDEPLSAFAGKDLNGTWNLKATDAAGGDTGTIYCVQLDIQKYICCGQAGTPNIVAAGSSVTTEDCSPANGAVDPGEGVTVDLGLRNTGDGATSSLVATLLPGGGVTNPGPPQAYGAIAPGGPTVTRSFTFTADPLLPCGSTLTLTLQLQDGATDLGTAAYPFVLGTTVTSTYGPFANTGSISIPASGTAAGAAAPYPSTLAVSGVPLPFNGRVTATLTGMNHTFPADLDILLVGPQGQAVMLLSDTGGGTDIVNVNLTFDDAAAALVPTTIVSGTYRPTNSGAADGMPAPAPPEPYSSALSAFSGTNPNGTWSLYVYDDAGGDVGNVSGGWSLNFHDVNPSCCIPAGACQILSCGATASPLGGNVPLPVSFTGTVATLNCSDTPVFTWDFGDGSPTATGQAVSHTYTTAGTFIWAMTVTVQGQICTQGGSVNITAPGLGADGSTLVEEFCTPPNGAVDPDEGVTVGLTVRNTGTGPTTNLVGTLQAGAGVTSPGAPQVFGAVAPGTAVTRNFTFVADPSFPCGSVVTALLHLEDGPMDYGSVTYSFVLGSTITSTGGPFANTATITIPASGTAAGAAAPYPSTIAVSGLPATLVKVTATLTGINHTYPDDLDILLVGPQGQKMILMSDAGGSTDLVNVNLTFDDDAATSLPDATAITSGTYKPTNWLTGDTWPAPAPAGPYGSALSAFVGTNPNGNWSLYVYDDVGGDIGNISGGWSLNFVVSTPDCCVDTTPCTLLSCDGTADPVYGPAPLAVNFTATAQTQDCTATPTYTWDFGDGTFGTGQSVSHTYTTDGVYAWTLTTTVEGRSCTDTGTVEAVYCVAPAIGTQPQPATVCLGETVTLTVGATGTPTPNYQWSMNGAPVGADSPTYVTNPLDPTATYTVTVSNLCGTVTSDPAVVTVNVGAAILGATWDQTVCGGESAHFALALAGTPPPAVAWYDSEDGVNFTLIPGATSANYTTPALTQRRIYKAVVANSCGNDQKIMIVEVVDPPVVTLVNPESQQVNTGHSATLDVSYTGTEPVTIQWYEGETGDVSHPVDGATSAVFHTPQVYADTRYWVRVSNDCGHDDSESVSVVVWNVYYLPHAVSTSEWWTKVSIVNAGGLNPKAGEAVDEVEVRAYNSAGGLEE
ncbi:MAG: S8 family serine peptidase, partial [Acidobacteria bacterium]|nr:S8 family serine peptidase [Acidobacteriota bacterium]